MRVLQVRENTVLSLSIAGVSMDNIYDFYFSLFSSTM